MLKGTLAALFVALEGSHRILGIHMKEIAPSGAKTFSWRENERDCDILRIIIYVVYTADWPVGELVSSRVAVEH